MEQLILHTHGSTNHDVEGEIIFIQVPQLRSVQRFVQKRIGQWIEQWSEMHGDGSTKLKSFFVVKFEKIGLGHQIFCTIQVVIGNRIWKGTALAAGLHRALIHSMGHLNVRFVSPQTLDKYASRLERPVCELSGEAIDFTQESAESSPIRNPMGLRLVR